MPDKWLTGNGYPCPACELQREARQGPTNCNRCGGSGRLERPVEFIIADHIAEARRHHWNKEPDQ